MSDVISILEERGFIDALTSEDIRELTKSPQTVYCGFDPTGDSLHIGNMVAIMGLAWFQRCGHKTVALVGGATGMIGDPSGKSRERQLLDEASLLKNVEGIKSDLRKILDFDHKTAPATLLNNYDWFKDFSFIDFLRDIGKHFRVGPMLGKESVRARFESEEGISFTEFSYQLLQGYDFLYLNDNLDVSIQIGGSDQWGNITAGSDLVRKIRGKQVFGVTLPLLTSSDGKKFGKSEEGAIWLSKEKLSPYQFYQYLYRINDADVIKLMRMLTFMDMNEIRDYEQKLGKPGTPPNSAQKRLAEEVTRLVHGEEGLATALKVTSAAKPGAETTLDAETLESIAADMPSHTLPSSDVVDAKLIDLIVVVGLQSSKGQARKLIQNGGVSINNQKQSDENRTITQSDLIDGRLLLITVGKKNKTLIRLNQKNN